MSMLATAQAPNRKPLVGHALNFKPDEMMTYFESTARETGTWNYQVDFGGLKPLIIGDPHLAQAICSPRDKAASWSGRPQFDALVDVSAEVFGRAGVDWPKGASAGIVFGNGPIHNGIPRAAADAGLSKLSFVKASSDKILRNVKKMICLLEHSSREEAPVDVQQKFNDVALDIIGEIAFEENLGAVDGKQTEFAMRMETILSLIQPLLMSPVPYWRYMPGFVSNDYTKLRDELERMMTLGTCYSFLVVPYIIISYTS